MHALKISINQEPAIIAGADNLDVLSAIISCQGKLGNASNVPEQNPAVAVVLRAGGMTLATPDAAAEYVQWIPATALQTGDFIRIEMVDSAHVHPAIGDAEEGAAKRQERERYIFENCKHTYFALKDKYETQ